MRPYRKDSGRLSEPPLRNPNMSLSSTSTQSGDGGGGGTSNRGLDRGSYDSPNDSTTSTVRRIKCVLVGDASVGKTSLIVSYTTNGYPQEYVPTAFDNYSVLVRVDNQPVQLQLCDTAGQADFDHLRPLCYPNVDIFLVCFSVVCPASFYNLQQRWIPEIRQHSPNTPCILVGTQSDQRTNVNTILNLSQYGETVITDLEAKEFAKDVKALQYVECSALTQHNLKEVFDSVILACMQVSAGGVDRSKVSLQQIVTNGGRKSFKKFKEKIKRSNSVDSSKHSSLQIRRQASNQRLNQVGLSPEKKPNSKKHSTHSAPVSAFYGSSMGLALKVTPEKKQQQNTSGKLKKGWRRLLCMA